MTDDEMHELAQTCLGSADIAKSLLAKCVLRLLSIAALRAAHPSPPPAESVPIRHGVNCEKVHHLGMGYLHAADDDRPYDVDGLAYCGRCHVALSAREILVSPPPTTEPS